jgi:hypothetical protein
MTPRAAVDKYVRLTSQIKELQAQRDLLKIDLPCGRNEGTVMDVRVGVSNGSRSISITKLRHYVTQAVLEKCMEPSGKRHMTYAIVSKLKPRKSKKAFEAALKEQGIREGMFSQNRARDYISPPIRASYARYMKDNHPWSAATEANHIKDLVK